MTGRLASEFIIEAGRPQKIYTVEAGKVLQGNIVLTNTTPNGAVIQVKRANGLVDPVANHAFSNARQLGNNSSERPGVILMDLGAQGLVTGDTGSPYASKLIDLSDPLAPVSPRALDNAVYPNAAMWGAADRFGYFDGSTYKRYAGTVNPWMDLSALPHGTVTAGTHQPYGGEGVVVGWGQYAVGLAQSRDELVFATNAGTSGDTTWQKDTFGNLGLYAAYTGSYWYGDFIKAHVTANGKFFVNYPSTSGYQYTRTAMIDVTSIGMGAGWAPVFGNWYRPSTPKNWIFHANGKYWVFAYRASNKYDWFVVDEGSISNAMPSAISGQSIQYTTYGYGVDSYSRSVLQLPDGNIVWRAQSGYFLLNTTTGMVEEFQSDIASYLVPDNYTDYRGSKLNEVNIGTVEHTAPRPGAADPDNDRIAYTNQGIFDFVTDNTWGLQDVTDDSGWIDYDLSLSSKGEVEYKGRMFAAQDEIWVRSNKANVTVSVEGYLI